VSRWRCRWLATARVMALFKRMGRSMHLYSPVSRCRCRWHHSHRPHNSKASRSLWSDSACDQQSMWAYSGTRWCVEHSCPVQKWQYSQTGIKMNLFFRIHIPKYLTVSTITTTMRQAWEDKCKAVGEGSFVAVGQGSFVAVGHGSFVLLSACYWSTVACVCQGAVAWHGNTDVMTPVMRTVAVTSQFRLRRLQGAFLLSLEPTSVRTLSSSSAISVLLLLMLPSVLELYTKVILCFLSSF